MTSRPPIEIVPPLVCLEARDQAQQGRFSAARRADEHHEVAIGNRQVDAMDDMDIAEGFADPLEFQTCHACPPVAGSCQAFSPSRAAMSSMMAPAVRRTTGAHAASCRLSMP